MKSLLLIILLFTTINFFAQNRIYKLVFSKNKELETCIVQFENQVIKLNEKAEFSLTQRKGLLKCKCYGYDLFEAQIDTLSSPFIHLIPNEEIQQLAEVEIYAFKAGVLKKNTPIITSIYTKKQLQKNPVPNLIEAMDRMTGVRPQNNCNVCGTGDIHLNGLEGPYTLVVIDGIPLMGGLSTVYGLSGIPSFIIESVEITRGPSSSIYGSESIGGVIEVNTKKLTKPSFSFQHFVTSDLEFNTDIGVGFTLGEKVKSWLGYSSYFLTNRIDKNKDNFTDIPLINRHAFFNTYHLDLKKNGALQFNYRLVDESRWGGELQYQAYMRGTDERYAESIDTKRAEASLSFQLPTKEKILFQSHANLHKQDSYYGLTPFEAKQTFIFNQLLWNKKVNKHLFLTGLANRNTFYDDNTFLSFDSLRGENKQVQTQQFSLFLEDVLSINEKNQFMLSTRMDYQKEHGFIFTPRLAYQSKIKTKWIYRLNLGKGFRSVNLFTEDHAALTGARNVVINEDLKPEESYSANTSLSFKHYFIKPWLLEFQLQGFYTYFTNRIVADYLTNSNEINYSNLNGFGENFGGSIETQLNYKNQLSLQLGFQIMDVRIKENGLVERQLLTERWSSNATLSYTFNKIPLAIDYTMMAVGSMLLPTLSELDPRPIASQPYSIQNLQFSYTIKDKLTFFGGVKNIFNWTPAQNIPFLIARAFDPFDKNVSFDQNGNVLTTSENPNALSFDPSYVYANNQGRRFFFGLRFSFEKK